MSHATRSVVRGLVLLACAALGIATGTAVLQLAAPPVRLEAEVAAHLESSGVTHPVTAVLLNFRGYDTLLEIAVLLLALLGVLAASDDEPSPGRRLAGAPQPLLQAIVRVLSPLMVLVAGYLLWAGARQPGGAFQAGAVLAATAVLLYLAGLIHAWIVPGKLLRIGLTSGFLVFLGIAAAVLPQGALLQYPPRLAGALILLIEMGLTLSLGLLLAGLFLWLPNEHEESET